VGMNTNEGSASSEVFLAPNQKALILKDEKTFDISDVENMEVYTAWVDGYLTFTNEDVSVLLKKISRYYNADIEVDLPKDWEKIYGKLDLKEDIERVLDGIAFISKTRYEKRDNKYIFFSNEQ
jgi:ferric-dicitrate binding protein FerR (iron transport regulator)